MMRDKKCSNVECDDSALCTDCNGKFEALEAELAAEYYYTHIRLQARLEDTEIAARVAINTKINAEEEFIAHFNLPTHHGSVVWALDRRFKPSKYKRVFYRGQYAIGYQYWYGQDGHDDVHRYDVYWTRNRAFATDFYFVGKDPRSPYSRGIIDATWSEFSKWSQISEAFNSPQWFNHRYDLANRVEAWGDVYDRLDDRPDILVKNLLKIFEDYFDGRHPSIVGFDINEK